MYALFFADKLPPVDELILQHDVLNTEVNNPLYGYNVKKHLIQNSSLLAHIDRAGLVKDDTLFIEFGAGKGIHSLYFVFYSFFNN